MKGRKEKICDNIGCGDFARTLNYVAFSFFFKDGFSFMISYIAETHAMVQYVCVCVCVCVCARARACMHIHIHNNMKKMDEKLFLSKN